MNTDKTKEEFLSENSLPIDGGLHRIELSRMLSAMQSYADQEKKKARISILKWLVSVKNKHWYCTGRDSEMFLLGEGKRGHSPKHVDALYIESERP